MRSRAGRRFCGFCPQQGNIKREFRRTDRKKTVFARIATFLLATVDAADSASRPPAPPKGPHQKAPPPAPYSLPPAKCGGGYRGKRLMIATRERPASRTGE